MQRLTWTEFPMFGPEGLVRLPRVLEIASISPIFWIFGSYEGIGAGWGDLNQLEFEERVADSMICMTAVEMVRFAAQQEQTINANLAAIASGIDARAARHELLSRRIGGIQAVDSTTWRIGVAESRLSPQP